MMTPTNHRTRSVLALRFSIVLILLSGTTALHAQNEWTGDGNDNLWSNPDNWLDGEVPSGERVKVNGPFAAGENAPVIDDSTEAIAEILISDAGEASMSMIGGSLELSGWGMWWGDAVDSVATFNMSGGEIEFTGSPGIMELGWQDSGDEPGSSVGIWNMTGGEIFAQGVDMPGKGNGGTAVINLDGGTINVGTSRGGLMMYEGGMIDITAGQLILEGDLFQVEDYIDEGWIVAYGGDGELVIQEEGDFTTISAIGGVPGDFDRNGTLNAEDLDLLSSQVREMTNASSFDLNADALVNDADRLVWIKDLKNTWIGDADLNGEFNSGDFVQVFSAGQYEDGIDANSTWATGDFNGDQEFDSGDFVVAFQDGGYELGIRNAAQTVPEPSAIALLLVGLLASAAVRR